jgi:flagellar basal-body rod modification protein FlgD
MIPINPSVAAAADTTSTSGSATSSTSSATPGGNVLDKDAFLKLMMVQLQHQDPLQPTDPTQYVNELSQLTTLEQTTNMAKSAAQTASEQHTTAALALLGHTVSYTDKSGAAQTGKVDKVQFTSSGPTLTIDGTSGIDPSTVDEVS